MSDVEKVARAMFDAACVEDLESGDLCYSNWQDGADKAYTLLAIAAITALDLPARDAATRNAALDDPLPRGPASPARRNAPRLAARRRVAAGLG